MIPASVRLHRTACLTPALRNTGQKSTFFSADTSGLPLGRVFLCPLQHVSRSDGNPVFFESFLLTLKPFFLLFLFLFFNNNNRLYFFHFLFKFNLKNF